MFITIIILITIIIIGTSLFLTFIPDIVINSCSNKKTMIETDKDVLIIRENNNLSPIEKANAINSIREIKTSQLKICLKSLVCPNCSGKLEKECCMYFEDEWEDLYLYSCIKCNYNIEKYE